MKPDKPKKGGPKKESKAKLPQDERRKHARLEVDGFAEVIAADASIMFRGRIRDLSPTGCYIETRARINLSIGAAVELCFTVNERSFTAVAEIKGFRVGEGVGFEIHQLTADKRAPDDLLALIHKLESPLST